MRGLPEWERTGEGLPAAAVGDEEPQVELVLGNDVGGADGHRQTGVVREWRRPAEPIL
jgi:hypothetical protein